MLTFIPTPIGNREDITLRALDALRDANLIACEDTRHSGSLLKFYDIQKPLVSLHDHNEMQRIPDLIARAREGQNVAVISDAGTPLISDPGYRLLQACIEEDIPHTILPGPSAVITALAGSGLPCHSFSFEGFLPVKKGKRGKALAAASTSGHTVLFFESPHRLLSTLQILAEMDADIPICVARELTKKFETYHRGSASSLYAEFSKRPAKGEIVLLIDGSTPKNSSS